MPLGRLVRQVADRAQGGTQGLGKRPYGVGLLVAGYDASGAGQGAAWACWWPATMLGCGATQGRRRAEGGLREGWQRSAHAAAAATRRAPRSGACRLPGAACVAPPP